MNHLHLSVPSLAKARDFYEGFFGFRFAFAEDHITFLRDEAGFLLALHESKDGAKVDFPSWFHFGFCLESPEKVKQAYERLRAGGAEFARELQVHESWVTFSCWAPGPYKLEVFWDSNS
ncbi:MAG: VOC family protein [Bdellovibrionota bacterium]